MHPDEIATDADLVRRLLVAQFPESATSWPFTFQKCHSAKEWRRPTAEEMEKARKFYGEFPNAPGELWLFGGDATTTPKI